MEKSLANVERPRGFIKHPCWCIDDNNVINETVPNTGIHDINYGLIIFILLGLFISTNIIYFLVKIVDSQKGNR